MRPSGRYMRLLSVWAGLALAVCAPRASAWGRVGYESIAAATPLRYPPEMAATHSFDAELLRRVMDPDRRKSDGRFPGERFRHYFDVDEYPDYATGRVPADRALLERRHGAGTVRRRGLLPWAVVETMQALEEDMRAGRWEGVPRHMADLCHYVGDLHQPLHATGNVDGQKTGQRGIHARYESEMLARHASQLELRRGAARRVSAVPDAVFAAAYGSQRLVESVLAADRECSAAGVGTPQYYGGMWGATRELTRARLAAAADLTGSLIYTAWIRAGRPTPPAGRPLARKL